MLFNNIRDPVTMVTGVLSDVSKLVDFLLYFTRDLNHLDTRCLNPVDPCSCDNNCGTITYDTMHRSPGLLVSSINRVQLRTRAKKLEMQLVTSYAGNRLW